MQKESKPQELDAWWHRIVKSGYVRSVEGLWNSKLKPVASANLILIKLNIWLIILIFILITTNLNYTILNLNILILKNNFKKYCYLYEKINKTNSAAKEINLDIKFIIAGAAIIFILLAISYRRHGKEE